MASALLGASTPAALREDAAQVGYSKRFAGVYPESGWEWVLPDVGDVFLAGDRIILDVGSPWRNVYSSLIGDEVMSRFFPITRKIESAKQELTSPRFSCGHGRDASSASCKVCEIFYYRRVTI